MHVHSNTHTHTYARIHTDILGMLCGCALCTNSAWQAVHCTYHLCFSLYLRFVPHEALSPPPPPPPPRKQGYSHGAMSVPRSTSRNWYISQPTQWRVLGSVSPAPSASRHIRNHVPLENLRERLPCLTHKLKYSNERGCHVCPTTYSIATGRGCPVCPTSYSVAT